MVAILAYSTTTGQTPFLATGKLNTAEEVIELFVEPEADPHCFVCSRHTDHFAEHDALVEAGLAVYAEDGSVLRTAKWDDTLAAQISQAEYEAYCAKFEV